MQYVYPYINNGDDVLRYSIASVYAVDPTATVLLVGDKPPFPVPAVLLPVTRRHDGTALENFRDVLHKMRVISLSNVVADRFVLMHDDILIIDGQFMQTLDPPRYMPPNPNASRFKKWSVLRQKTQNALEARGHTTHNYATHLPRLVQRDVLADLMAATWFNSEPLLWEVAYENVRGAAGREIAPGDLQRVLNGTDEDIHEAMAASPMCLNFGSRAWTDAARAWAVGMFGDAQ